MIFDMVSFVICTQCHAACSVIIANFPTLKSFLNNTSTGMLDVSIAPRSGATYGFASYNNRRMSSLSKLSHHPLNDSSKRSSTGFQRWAENEGKEAKLLRPEEIHHRVAIESKGNSSRATARQAEDDTISIGDLGSDKIVVLQSTEWQIQYGNDQRLHDDMTQKAWGEIIP
jgi:hypothetical protein